MAPIATSDSSTTFQHTSERIGQLKLNATPAPVQSQKKQDVRTVDPFNYVVSSQRPRHECTDRKRERLTEMYLTTNMPTFFVSFPKANY